MEMNKNTKTIIAVVAVLAIVVVVAAIFLNGSSDPTKDATDMENSELKVFGNINGDGYIDSKDVTILEALVKDGKTVKEYPLADANQDGKLSQDDVDLLNKIIKRENCTIWHLNFHDTDKDGIMDTEIKSSKFPISSVICTGSSNTFMMLMMANVIDEVKGASYSSIDNVFKNTFQDETKVVRLGSSAGKIEFEDGKGAASELIKKENVTAVLSDWNRTYLTNEDDFEKAGVDVIRFAAAAVGVNDMVHNYYFLGLLFGKQDRATEVAEYMKESMKKIESAVGKENKAITAVVSSMTNYFSVGGSDYNQVAGAAGAKLALNDSSEFGGTTSIKVLDNLDVFNTDKYRYDYIIHIRTYNGYTNEQDMAALYDTCTKTIKEYWEHGTDGQVIINGNMPIPARIAYVASLFYDDIDKSWADEIHQGFIKFFTDTSYDVSKLTFIYEG